MACFLALPGNVQCAQDFVQRDFDCFYCDASCAVAALHQRSESLSTCHGRDAHEQSFAHCTTTRTYVHLTNLFCDSSCVTWLAWEQQPCSVASLSVARMGLHQGFKQQTSWPGGLCGQTSYIPFRQSRLHCLLHLCIGGHNTHGWLSHTLTKSPVPACFTQVFFVGLSFPQGPEVTELTIDFDLMTMGKNAG